MSDQLSFPIDDGPSVFGLRLEVAMQLSGLTQVAFAKEAGIKGPRSINKWIRGTAPYTRNVDGIAQASAFPSHYFLLKRPPSEVSGLNYFIRVNAPQYARDRFSAFGSLLGDMLSLAARDITLPQMTLAEFEVPIEEASDRTPEIAAAHVRAQFGQGDRRINLVSRAEELGVVVVFGPSEIVEVDGYSGWTAGRPFIVLNPARIDPSRLRMTIAHELGHLVMHRNTNESSDADRAVREKQAHRFARALLLPQSADFQDRLRQAVEAYPWPPLVGIQNEFDVAVEELLTFAQDLRIVSASHVATRAVKWASDKHEFQESASQQPTESPRLMRDLLDILSFERGLTIEDLASEVGIPMRYVRIMRAQDGREAAQHRTAPGSSSN